MKPAMAANMRAHDHGDGQPQTGGGDDIQQAHEKR